MFGTFYSEKIFNSSPTHISGVVAELKSYYTTHGYEYNENPSDKGGVIIKVTKGGDFRRLLGLQSALEITLEPTSDNTISFKAGIGFWEQQGLATAISALLASTTFITLVTQAWGVIHQAHLDDQALEIAERRLKELEGDMENVEYDYCPNCRRKAIVGKPCPHCGQIIQSTPPVISPNP